MLVQIIDGADGLNQRQKMVYSCLHYWYIYIALYISYLAKNANTSAPFLEAVSTLSWVDQIAAVENITKHTV